MNILQRDERLEVHRMNSVQHMFQRVVLFRCNLCGLKSCAAGMSEQLFGGGVMKVFAWAG